MSTFAEALPQAETTLPHTEALQQEHSLSETELIKLHQAIDTALPDQSSRFIQFLSCYPREGTGTIACELAALEAHAMHNRALFIAMDEDKLHQAFPDSLVKASLLDVALGRAEIGDAITDIRRNSGCECAYLMPGSDDEFFPNLGLIKEVLGRLRDRFDYIILSTPGVLTDPATVHLSSIADASILVIEAEKTRAPATKRALEMFGDGTRLIGIVFNKRRYHIPNWLYRLL